MNASLRERFERLGPVRTVDRVSSGLPFDLILTPVPDRAFVGTVIAALALARRGMTLLGAKRALEEMQASGSALVVVPTVEDVTALSRALDAAGIGARTLANGSTVDVR